MPEVKTNTSTYESKALQASISKEVILAYAGPNPFLAKLKQKGGITIRSTTREKVVKDFGKPTTTNVGARSEQDTQIQVATGDGIMFTTGALVLVSSTGEQMLVVGVNGDTLTVARGYGETPAQAIDDGALLVFLGIAYSEGASDPVVVAPKAIKTQNLTQIFRTKVVLTGSEEEVDAVDTEWKLRKQEGLIEHLGEIERQLLFGDMKDDVERQKRTMKGIKNFIKTNVVDLGGSITAKKIADAVIATAKRNAGKKVLFASSELMTAIEAIAQDAIRVEPGSKEFGATVARWLVGSKDVEIIHNPVIDEAGFAGYGILVDMKNVNYCHLGNRDTKFIEYDRYGFDGRQGEYLTECTLEMGDESTHAIIFNP